MPIGLITPMDQGQSMKEDVTDFITNISYATTPFYSSLSESQAQNTLHSWLVDAFAASADNAAIEGNDLVFTDPNVPTRSSNVVQLFQKDIRVSNTEMRVAHYGMGDPYTYQLNKKMTEMARDIEKALVAGTTASGSSGVARRLNGAIALITSNKTARASGTSYSETEFNDQIESIYDGGTDLTVDKVFSGAAIKRSITGFNGGPGSQRIVQQADEKLYNTVSTYVSDFGIHQVYLEREVPSGVNAKGVLMVDSSKWRVAYLIDGRPQHIPLATIGSAKRGMLEAELTLEALNQGSSAYRSGYQDKLTSYPQESPERGFSFCAVCFTINATMAQNHKQLSGSKDRLEEAVKLGDSTKMLMSDVVGMPDALDKEHIQRLIMKYEQVHPGWIKHTRDTAREELSGFNRDFAVVDKQAARRYMLELPEELNNAIEKYIPTIFRDPKHFAWFIQNFKELMIPEKW